MFCQLVVITEVKDLKRLVGAVSLYVTAQRRRHVPLKNLCDFFMTEL